MYTAGREMYNVWASAYSFVLNKRSFRESARRVAQSRAELRCVAPRRAAPRKIETRPVAKIAYRMLVNSWQPGIPRDGRAKRKRRVIKYVSRYTDCCLPAAFTYMRVCASVSLPPDDFLPATSSRLVLRYFAGYWRRISRIGKHLGEHAGRIKV